MDEFNGINTFFNMIYHNDRAFSRALLNYQSFNDYRQWLRNHHIEFKELDMIDEYSFSMIRPDMTIKDVSMLTHTNLQEGLQRIRSFFKDKTFLFLIPGTNKEIENYYNNEAIGDMEINHILITADVKDDAKDDEKKAAEETA